MTIDWVQIILTIALLWSVCMNYYLSKIILKDMDVIDKYRAQVKELTSNEVTKTANTAENNDCEI